MATSSGGESPSGYAGGGIEQSEADDLKSHSPDYAAEAAAHAAAALRDAAQRRDPRATPVPAAPRVGGRRVPLMLREGEAANRLLTEAVRRAKETKDALREAMLARHSIHVPSVLPVGASQASPITQAAAFIPGASPGAEAGDAHRVSDPRCEVRFEPRSGVTEMLARVTVGASRDEMALLIDPRAWCATGGVVAATFIVEEESGEYFPSGVINDIGIGSTWESPRQTQLLYEYARSEVASFENILRIGEFTVRDDQIVSTYSLYDCLVCTFGAFSAPGGLTLNEGHIKATCRGGDTWDVEVLKRVRVRDLTPRDPGNRYDFGQWINSTIGAALSQWVRDASIMSPVL